MNKEDIILKTRIIDLESLTKDAIMYYENEQWVLLERTVKMLTLTTDMIKKNLLEHERFVPVND